MQFIISEIQTRMSRTQAEYYAYTPRTQFNSKEVREQIAPIFIFTDTEQQYI
jgi:hypothetical protein